MIDSDGFIATAIAGCLLVNLIYVALRLRKDIRDRDMIFICLGVVAVLVSLTAFAFGGFIWWLEYTDFSIGW